MSTTAPSRKSLGAWFAPKPEHSYPLSRAALLYVGMVLLAGFGVGVVLMPTLGWTPVSWPTFGLLLVSATATQLAKIEGPKFQLYHASPVFFFAGLLLLPPAWLVLLIVVVHLVEWLKERAMRGPLFRSWYVQPFNVAMFILTALCAQVTYQLIEPTLERLAAPAAVIAVIITAVVYVALNSALNGVALRLARGVSFKDSHIFEMENVGPELILLLLGAVVAQLWQLAPAFVPLAAAPVVLMYRALLVPRLKHEAQTDTKTGLLNAQYGHRALTAELARARRFDHPLTVIMADLDLLRSVNNTYGHLAGDLVLAGVAAIIQQHLREYDVAGRFGGEEFVIMLPETDGAAARPVLEHIRAAIAAHPFVVPTSESPLHVTMSFGLACFPADGCAEEALLHAADRAVYAAKRAGRNCVASASEISAEPDLAQKFDARPVAQLPDAGVAQLPPSIPPAPVAAAPAPAPAPAPTTQPEPAAATPARAGLPVLAWLYVVALIGGATLIAALEVRDLAPANVWTFLGLLALATIAQAYQADGADHMLFYVTPVFLFAGVLLLPPWLMLLLIVIPHLVEWGLARWLTSPHLRRWYIQPFNIAKYVLAGTLTLHTAPLLALGQLPAGSQTLVLGLSLAAVFLGLDRTLLNGVLILSQRISWHDLRAMTKGMLTEYLLLTIGFLFSVVLCREPWLAPLVVGPLVVMHQALKLPKVQVDNLRQVHQINQELSQANQAIHRLNDELFLTLAKIFDARDPYVGGHASQVAAYAVAIATEIGLPPERVDIVRQAGYLHDIGKMAIPETILHKPTRLTADEYEAMKTHVAIGAELLETSQGLRHLAPFVRHHHERWDGQGYPDGLAGDAIPLEARILNVCDSVEAMAADRPYHRGLSVDEIIAEVRRCRGSQFDPSLANVFIEIAERERERFVVNSASEVQRRYSDSANPLYGRNIQALADVYQSGT